MRLPVQLAFTLVELIVVITILAILGTIGFVSLQGYSVNARDSVRISDTKTFLKALNIYQTKNGEVPLPDDMTTITGSGVVFSYQGTLSGSVITELGQGQVPVDPLLKIPYLYATNEGRTKVQLLSYHEKNTSSLELQSMLTHAETTYTDMFPKVIGDEIGILLNEDNSPVIDPEIYLPDNMLRYTYIISNTESISQSGVELLAYTPLSSCKKILQSGMSHGSGDYTLNPTGLKNIKVYCDMEKDGGGWTMVFVAKGARLLESDIHPLGYLRKLQSSSYNISNLDNLLVLSGGIDHFSDTISHTILESQEPGYQQMQFTLLEDWPYYDDIVWERWLPQFQDRQEFAGPGLSWHNIYRISGEEKTNMNFLSNKRYQGQGWDFTFRGNRYGEPIKISGSYILAPSGEKLFSDICDGCFSHSLMNPGRGRDGFFVEHTYGAWRLYHSSYQEKYPFKDNENTLHIWPEYEALNDGDVMPGWAMYIR